MNSSLYTLQVALNSNQSRMRVEELNYLKSSQSVMTIENQLKSGLTCEFQLAFIYSSNEFWNLDGWLKSRTAKSPEGRDGWRQRIWRVVWLVDSSVKSIWRVGRERECGIIWRVCRLLNVQSQLKSRLTLIQRGRDGWTVLADLKSRTGVEGWNRLKSRLTLQIPSQLKSKLTWWILVYILFGWENSPSTFTLLLYI